MLRPSVAMENVLDFQAHLPTPTKKSPYCQLDWIFRDKISLYSNVDTQANYVTALCFYKRFLKHTNNYSTALEKDSRFFIKHEWDVFALHKVKRWLDVTNIAGNDNYLTSYSVTSIISALRQTMEHAYEHSYIEKPVINVIVPTAARETSLRTAYSLDEYEQIFEALTPQIQFSKGLLRPYVPTGKGRDPRKLNRANIPRGSRVIGQGFLCLIKSNSDNKLISTDDNLRWYFENVMNCVPLPSTRENFAHSRFFQAAKAIHGSLRTTYRNWGVASFIDSDVITPLLVELISETGLNVESALSLRRDCFKPSHPLTGLPFLEYDKPRSGGTKELHLALYDNPRGRSLGLRQRQSRIIGNSISTILKLTEPLVSQARLEDQEYLFLIESRRRTSRDSLGRIKRLTLQIAEDWTERFAKEHDLSASNNEHLFLNLSRFRPTKITEMVSQGFDFFDIMTVAGHSSIITTLSYIDRLGWAADFHRRMDEALNRIRKNKQEFERNPLPVAITRNAVPSQFVFKAPMCFCKNPYDPPAAVRNSESYHEGDACTFFNMCLSCDNVLITELNLPKLIAYQHEIESALAQLHEIPRQGELYSRTKMLLDEVLKPEILFSKDSIDWATQLAEIHDFEVLDPFISRSIED